MFGRNQKFLFLGETEAVLQNVNVGGPGVGLKSVLNLVGVDLGNAEVDPGIGTDESEKEDLIVENASALEGMYL